MENPAGKTQDQHEKRACFVVGIGASSGGQGPLEHFFTTFPGDCQLAFVVIMHLPADGPSVLCDLIRRYTPMEVVNAEDGEVLRPNTVHVISPGVDLTVRDGRICLHGQPGITSGLHHPIDRFLTSLAEDFGEHAIGVILSGVGRDGARGGREIKQAGGTVLVQDPETALYTSMPEHVIATGAADFVLPVEEITEKIAAIAKGQCDLPRLACRTTTLEEDLAAIFSVVKAASGHDFSSYKRNTVLRRLERRMTLHESGGLRKYLAFLEQNPLEARALAQEILIGVTKFFRDPQAFDILRSDVLPGIFAGRDPEDPVRIWHACCATGEEAYSVAMLVREYLDRENLHQRVQIFATDIDEGAVAQGRSGLYSEDIMQDVGGERLNTFFTRHSGRLQVAKDLREMILFANHNLIKDPPFSRLDLLVCRNFLIYLNPDMQKRLISLFHMVLKPGGFLFLGASESTGANSGLFAPLDQKWKIFRRLECDRRGETAFPFTAPALKLSRGAMPKPPVDPESPSPGALAERLLVERYAPPCLVVNDKYEVLHISSRTRRYLEVPVGEPTVDLLKMAREELRPALRAAIYKAFAEHREVDFRGVKLAGPDGEGTVNIKVEPLDSRQAHGNLVLVTLEPGAPPPSAQVPADPQGGVRDEFSRDQLNRQLEEQLRITHEQLQFTTEQLEASNEGFMATNEELMSINEEFQSANEELQSTNEELEASKEELQALNEELVTVNAELQGKVEELDQARSDMENLFASSGIATVFLDRQLIIKSFSPAMAGLLNLIPADIGRPFRQMGGCIDWSALPQNAREVLEKQVPISREVSSSENGRSFIMRVLPYRTTEGNVDGIVITLTDITELKRAEAETRSTALFPLENPEPVLRIGPEGNVDFANRSAETLLCQWREEFGQEIPDSLRRSIDQALGDGILRQHDVDFSGGCISFNVAPIPDRGYANLYGRDVTGRKQAEEAVRKANEEWKRTFDSVPDLIAILDDRHRITRVNRAMAEKLGLTPAECVGKACFQCVHGTDKIPDSCPHALTMKDGLEHTGEIHEDNLGGDFLVSTTPLKDSTGRMVGSVHVARDISERKKMEDALRASEQMVRDKLESILSPEGDIGDLELKDIIDIPALQNLMENFYDLSGVPMGLFDLQGNRLVGVGWQAVSTDFHRSNPLTLANCLESDTELSAGIPEGEYRIYKCKNGMWDIATPIMVGGQQLGNLFLGQFLFEGEQPNYDLFRSQAARYGFPEDEYLAALDAVPRYSREMVDRAMAFFMQLSGIISRLSYANIELARTLGEREALMTSLRAGEERLSTIFNSAHDAIFVHDSDQKILAVNDKMVELYGVSREEALHGHRILDFSADEGRDDDARQLWQEVLSGQSRLVEWQGKNLKTGRVFDAEIYLTRIDYDGREAILATVRDISDRKRAEAARRESEQRLRLFIEHAPAALAMFDREMRYLVASHRWRQDYHIGDRDLLGVSHYEIFPEGGDEWKEAHRRGLAGEVVRSESDRFVCADGSVQWVRWEIRPWYNFVGEVGGVVLFAEDITNQKRSEAKIRRQNEILTGINRMFQGALWSDSEEELGEICLEAAIDITGSKLGFIGEIGPDGLFHDIVISDKGWEVCALFNGKGERRLPGNFHIRGVYGSVLLKGQGFYDNEPSTRADSVGTPEGHPPLESFLGVPLLQEDRIIGMVAVGNREGGYSDEEQEALEALAPAIVEALLRKRAEKERNFANQRLALLARTAGRLLASDNPQLVVDELCRKVMEALDCQVFFNFLVDGNAGRLHLNAWAGIPEEEAKKIEWLDYGVAVCGCAARDASRIVAENIPDTPDPRTELVESYGIQAYACHPLMVRGQVLGTLSFGTRARPRFSDDELAMMKAVADQVAIAMERRQGEEALQQAHDELESKVEERTLELREKDRLLLQQSRQAAMGEMINNIAHQWRQPLNGLGLIVQSLPMMQESGQLNRKNLEGVGDKAMDIIFHMSQTIDDFRNYFKPDREKVRFPVSRAISRTLKLIGESFRNLEIAIEVEAAEDPVIFGYPNEFGQVLLNILINSRDAFSERKVREAKIAIKLGRENGNAVVTIVDNAGGIHGDIMEKIFEPYFTTKGPEHGTGIGLFMSKTIIEKNMGGKLAARNTADGAEFKIEV